jgi:hypothetical protein
LLKNSNAEPFRSFVPDLVMTVMAEHREHLAADP